MEKKQYKNLEVKRIKEVVKDLEQKGYKVLTEPSKDLLPVFLQNYQPDIIATKNNENIVIEVISKATLNKADYLEDIAKKIQENKGWSFELVLTNPRKNEFDDENESSVELIKEKINDSKALLSKEYIESAFLISWASFESVTRKTLRKEQPKTSPQLSPNALIKQLFSYGIIGKLDYNFLEKMSKKRNEIVHGFFSTKNNVQINEVERINNLINNFIQELEEH